MLLRAIFPVLFLLAPCLFPSPLAAREAAPAVHPFTVESMERIAAARQGRPFVVAFWSIGCTHCPQELKTLGELKKRHPRLDIVLVAADAPEDAPQAGAFAARFGLGQAEQWIFADDMPERLRFRIDPGWHGELPRTYFYDSAHRAEGVSGIVPPARFDAWIAANLR